MESYYSKIDCREVILFLDEWGWSESGRCVLKCQGEGDRRVTLNFIP
jgi:hypothetical protein